MKNSIKIEHPDYHHNRQLFYGSVLNDQWHDYRWQLQQSIDSPEKLIRFTGALPAEDFANPQIIKPFRITPHQIALINWTDPWTDPVFRQIFPDPREYQDKSKNHKLDPFSEQDNSPVNNAIQRYRNRLLIITTNLCVSYCRYCTRKWKWGSSEIISPQNLLDIRDYLEKNPDINEVIFSGGDLLMLHPELIRTLVQPVYSLKSIKIIRIASRILSFLPQKVDNRLLSIFNQFPGIWLITHFNHIREITGETQDAIFQLRKTGAVLLNQSVLLKGINDHSDTLSELFTALTTLMIKPYYLFDCDPVAGTRHFKVGLSAGKKIVSEVRNQIGGISMPVYVRDTELTGKIPL